MRGHVVTKPFHSVAVMLQIHKRYSNGLYTLFKWFVHTIQTVLHSIQMV